jgi:hypothetical protein
MAERDFDPRWVRRGGDGGGERWKGKREEREREQGRGGLRCEAPNK